MAQARPETVQAIADMASRVGTGDVMTALAEYMERQADREFIESGEEIASSKRLRSASAKVREAHRVLFRHTK